MLAIPAFQARTQTALFRANNKPPLEVVVANLEGKTRLKKRQHSECCRMVNCQLIKLRSIQDLLLQK